jgi:hypothetical protein
MSESPALPFHPAPPGWTPPAAVPSRPGLPPLQGVPPDLSTTPAFGAPLPRGTLPDWFESGHAPPPAPAIEVPRVAPPPLISSPAWSALSPSAVTPSPNVPLLVPAPVDGPLGALEASNAAAGLIDAPPVRVEPEPAAPASPAPAPASPAGVVVELIWFDPPAAQRLSQHPLFAQLCRPVTAPKAPEPAADARSAEDAARAAAYDVLTRAAPTPAAALDGVLEGAEDESPPSPALVVVTGTLEICLDEVESLKALSAAASPLAGSDKKLKEAIDVAAEALKTPMQGMPDFAEGLGARIRDAWTRANRALPPEHLANCTERLLLEQRAYQKRELLDDTWIRALLTGEGPSVPVYLPARLAKRLPLFRRFPARLLAEIVWQQDQYESHPLALRTLALGRLPSRSRQPASRPRRRP